MKMTVSYAKLNRDQYVSMEVIGRICGVLSCDVGDIMHTWRDVTETFSESGRHYKDTYLEIDEVYNEEVEVSLFSTQEGPYEIYLSYGRMHGIIYVEADEAEAKREEVKKELAQEYEKHREPTGDFINMFCEKHQVSLPNDIFFDMSGMFDF